VPCTQMPSIDMLLLPLNMKVIKNRHLLLTHMIYFSHVINNLECSKKFHLALMKN